MPDDKKTPEEGTLSKIIKDCAKTILFPRLKKIGMDMFSDVVYTGAEYVTGVAKQKIYKKDEVIPNIRPDLNNSKRTPYENRFTTVNGSTPQKNSRPTYDTITRSSRKIDPIIMPTQGQADTIKGEMINRIQRYGKATVHDLYDAYNAVKYDDQERIIPNPTDMNFGWTKMSDITWSRTQEGWWLNFPDPESLINFR